VSAAVRHGEYNPSLTTPVQQARQALVPACVRCARTRAYQAALASALGWHYTKVSKLENGDRSRLKTTPRLVHACGADDRYPTDPTVRHSLPSTTSTAARCRRA